MRSPPRRLKTTLKQVAPIRTKTIREVSLDVSNTDSLKSRNLNRPVNTANKVIPRAPKAAASVGVAIPTAIEPSTARSKDTGANRSRSNWKNSEKPRT